MTSAATRAVLVPVKSFRAAKLRLAGVLDAPRREMLARELAARVISASAPAPVLVVCDDDEVASWAAEHGARVAWTPGLGLSAAVMAGVAQLASEGTELAIVAHADLPLAAGLATLGEPNTVTLVPDRRRDGTNVAVVPTGAGFQFAYGAGSFERHRAEAARLELPCEIVYDRRLALDVDIPEDLALANMAM
ncbi:MAG: 2-phospho-L-lactate guanylyltransferase [Acidimicrobiales bacterium]|jgi:2-phospho-L-lactate guanylyltransferase